MKSSLLFTALMLAFVGIGAGLADAKPADRSDQTRALLETFRDTYGFPGATVAYVLPDGSVGAVAVGLADAEANRPMTPASRMLAASIGKTIWSVLVLSLEAEGALARSDPVSRHLGYLPWYARVPNAETITVGQLLTHTAGLPDHVHMQGVAEVLVALGEAAPFDPASAIAFILDEPPLFKPGTAWAYGDTGYLLLGLVIEAATQRDVFALAEDHFLAPLGLDGTVPSNAPRVEGLAVGYTTAENPFGLPPRPMDGNGALVWNPAVEWTGGGFASTATDLARWGRALFTGAAMDAPYLDRLLESVPVHPDAPSIYYGSGVAIYRDTPHGQVYGHGGWIPGYVSSLRHYADHGVTIAFQINTDIGVLDDSSDLVPALEAALAELLLRDVPE